MNRNKVKIIIACFCLMFYSIATKAQSHYPGQHQGKFRIVDRFSSNIAAFDLQDVTLLPSRFTENMEREERWILSIPVNSLLHSFKTNAGVYSGPEGGYSPAKGTKKLAGWESLDCELRGHTAGHILSALALLYGTTKKPEFKIKADSIVAGLAEVQTALKQGGYLAAFSQGLIDRNLAGKNVWAPWYTLHKIYAGLIDQYLYCNNENALVIATKMGEWAYDKLNAINDSLRTIMLRNEFGGINDSFYNLYAITGNNHFKWLGDFFYHNEVLDPLKEKKEVLNLKHANTFIPKLIGLTRDYELQGKGDGMQMADFFWNTVVDHHSFATGSNSDKEHFFESDKIAEHLSGYTGETCNTYNMLKLTRHLFINSPDAKYADYYEKVLFNHIMGQQDPATGMVAYFLPMLPGAHKVYSTPDSSFWCCVGSGFENHAKYNEAIYYHDEKGVYVNLFIPSLLNWKEKGITIKQETAFPSDENVVLTIDADIAVKMPLYLRYPYWANNVEVKINGKKVNIQHKISSYITINRTWKKGDKVQVRYPMSLHLAPTNDNFNKAAVMYGPLVLAGMMGTEGMETPAPFSNPALHNDYYTYDYRVPEGLKTSLTINRKNLADVFKKSDIKNLVFTDEKDGVQLAPIYSIHHQRYVVYWDLK